MINGSISDGTIIDNVSYVVQQGTIGANLEGSAGLTMNGSSIVVLAGVNSYSGGTIVASGTLEAALPAALPGYLSNGVSVQNGATLAVALYAGLWPQSQIDLLTETSDFSSGSSLGVDTGSVACTYADTNLGPALGLAVLGSGTLGLTGTNTDYCGNITIAGPTLQVGSNACLGTSSATITFNGGTLQATSGVNVPDQIVLGQGGGVVDSNGCSVELDGQISGSGEMTVIDSSGGNGTVTVTCASNNYTGGTNLGSGTMAIGADGALGDVSSPLTFSGGTLQALSGFTLDPSRSIITPNDPSQAAVIDSDGSLVTVPCVISGSGGLTVIDSSGGYGTVVLAGDNTYLGTSDLEAGTLQLPNANALGPGGGGLIVNGGELDLDGQNILVGLLGGNGGIITNTNASTPSTLWVDQGSNAAYYGNIQDGGGQVCANLCGSGVLVLGGSNQYSAGTDVCSGLLVVTNASALPNGGALAVGDGADSLFGPSPGNSLPADPGHGGNSHGGGTIGPDPPATPAPPTGPVMIDPSPVISAIQCVGPTLVDADSVSFSVTVSKPITGLSTADFAVTGSGVSGIVTAVSGTGSSYAVTVGGISGSGSLGLRLVSGAGVLDWFGTPLDTAATIAVDQQYTIDRQLYYDASESGGIWNTGENWRVGPTGPLQGWVDGARHS